VYMFVCLCVCVCVCVFSFATLYIHQHAHTHTHTHTLLDARRAPLDKLMREADRVNMKMAIDERELEKLCRDGRKVSVLSVCVCVCVCVSMLVPRGC